MTSRTKLLKGNTAMKKITILLLVVVMLSVEIVFASCQNGQNGADTTKSSEVTTVETETEEATNTDKLPDPVPELDLGGYFCILNHIFKIGHGSLQSEQEY